MSSISFKNRRLLIDTKHAKEKVIVPLLESGLGVSCFINQGFDTDAMGTFTGEFERKDDPIRTVRRKKCDFKKEEMHLHVKTAEDPIYCDFCHP